MTKIDFKKSLKEFYAPGSRAFSIVTLPRMNFAMIDGSGSPDGEEYTAAVTWLFTLSFGIKALSRKMLDRDYVVPPLEGLWWAEDMQAFLRRDKDAWRWTSMIMQPDWITPDMFADGIEKATRKLGSPPESLRLGSFEEGLSVQILHIGPFSEEGPVIERMHKEFIPKNGLVENGHHHEIYLSDPRKTAPEKLKTVLRQPVKPA